MDEKRLLQILLELGLSRREGDIYLFLSKRGPQKAHAVATHLGIDRAQTYRSLTSLQEKGTVEVTLESPTRYMAISMDSLIESYVQGKRNDVARIEAEKDEIVKYFKSITAGEQEYPMARFQVITGKNAIFTRISQMIEQSKNEVFTLTTSLGLIQEDLAGIQDLIAEVVRSKKPVQFRMLTDISEDNASVVKSSVKRLVARGAKAEWRHTDLGSEFYPRFVIKDEEEALLYMISRDEQSPLQEDSGLWITSRMFVSTLKTSFMEIWRSATNATDRINELETGVPMGETTVIRDSADAQKRVQEVLDGTSREITMILSSTGANRLSENDPFRQYLGKGIKIRIMAPIDLDNLETAQELSRLYEVKHVSISYMSMMIADSRHLFMFKAPPLEEETLESPFYMRNTFYTNDQKYVERASELLNDIWRRGTLISEMISGGLTKTPVIEVAGSSSIPDVVDKMLENGVNSVLVKENDLTVGIIDQRDILDKVLRTRKDPEKTSANQIMSTPVLNIDSDEPLVEALKIMKEQRLRKVAVLRKGQLIAVLT